uniref:Domain of unknown function DB domain-containing protein n=1 Tax=Ditylenchus dipsaci TaxID=166011 RepID=A0A915CY09_9BILA
MRVDYFLIQGIHNCIIGKGADDYGDDKKYANSLLECLNGDRDNLDCCRREGVKGDCLRLCNGTAPQNIECLKFGLDQASG